MYLFRGDSELGRPAYQVRNDTQLGLNMETGTQNAEATGGLLRVYFKRNVDGAAWTKVGHSDLEGFVNKFLLGLDGLGSDSSL